MATTKEQTKNNTFQAGEDDDFQSVYINPLTDFGFKRIFLNMETYNTSLKQNFYLRDIANCAKMEGRMERDKQLALRLLKKGKPFEEVIDLTELSKEQVVELLHQLPKS